MKFTNSIQIAKPPSLSFSFVSQFSNSTQWNYAIIETEQISKGAVGLGTLFRQQRWFQGRKLADIFVVTEYTSNSFISIESTVAEYPFAISYAFTATERGTLLTNQIELHGPLIDMFGFALKSKIKNAVAQNLQKLKWILESN